MVTANQILWLFILALPIASISWTFTHEEVFKEPREYCKGRCANSKSLWQRKFFYLFTCEYCFSHYVTILMIMLTGYKLLMNDWRGYFIAGFSLVWIANIYMSIYGRIQVDIKSENIEINLKEKELKIENKNLEVDNTGSVISDLSETERV
ncbi:MAG: hypothetical protein WKF97_26055 [Chitinophagaceae bacterium]